jgi:multicomponent Na+:H+ antiporter subunit G
MIFNYFGWFFIGLGVTFDLLGCIGLVRFPDVYNRLQAATKSVTLGTLGIMFGIFLLYGFSAMGIKALVCGLFILLTAPVSAHALSRGALIFGSKMWKGTIVDKLGEDKHGGPQIEEKEQNGK